MALSRPVLANSIFTKEKKLGSGGFGDVYLVRHNSTDKRYALKTITCANTRQIALVKREVESLAKLQHRCIVQLFDADGYREGNKITCRVLMEFCDGGNLSERLCRESTFEVELKWMIQLASAVAYLHGQNTIHRDLKPDNVLLVGRRDEEDIKLGDFGLAREYIALIQGDEPENYLQYYLETYGGTRFFMAPEVFSRKYTEKADIFSLGIIFYCIIQRQSINIYGKKIFGCFEGCGRSIGQAMQEGDLTYSPPFTRRNNKQVTNIVSKMIRYHFKERPTGDEIEKALKEIQGGNQWMRPFIPLFVGGIVAVVLSAVFKR